MKKNYFEHEISSRFVDGVLKKDTKWQWLIDYIEEILTLMKWIISCLL